MTTRIILIRHGETIWNQERRSQGFSDIALSDKGMEQAKALAVAMKPIELSSVFSSDLVRAKRTADIIAAHHNLPVKMDVRLRELNQGELEGSRLENLLSEHPDLLKAWMENPAEVTMPGGESMLSLQGRAWMAIQDIVDMHPDRTVAVVAHNLCILAVIAKAIGLDLNNFRRLRMDNASISEIHFSSRGAVLTRMNDTSHLNSSSRTQL